MVPQVTGKILRAFQASSEGLQFTIEQPDEQGSIRFLDLRLHYGEKHLCWEFEPRSKKALLPYDSAHSKLVKRGIAMSGLGDAVKKSCVHTMERSFKG